MFEIRKNEDRNLFMLRWTARVFDAACLAILSLFIFGDNSDSSRATLNEMVGLLFFPVGLMIGLIVAWWKEFLGGAIAVGSVAAFYSVFGWLINGSFLELGWWFIVFAIPGALFLAYGIAITGGKTATGNHVEI